MALIIKFFLPTMTVDALAIALPLSVKTASTFCPSLASTNYSKIQIKEDSFL